MLGLWRRRPAGRRAVLLQLWCAAGRADLRLVRCRARPRSPRVYRARAEADLGVWLTSLGRAAQGEALLSGAREFFGEIGAVAWASDLEARLASYQAAEVLR